MAVKSKKVIHDQKEQVINYTDASLEFLGVPIAYTPFFSHPDPTLRENRDLLPPASVVHLH